MSEIPVVPEIKLTQLSHGGGCGCKIAPALLQEILGAAKEKLPYANLLADPQTSGGLLAAVAPEAVDEVLSAFSKEGFEQAMVIGTMKNGEARVSVG